MVVHYIFITICAAATAAEYQESVESTIELYKKTIMYAETFKNDVRYKVPNVNDIRDINKKVTSLKK